MKSFSSLLILLLFTLSSCQQEAQKLVDSAEAQQMLQHCLVCHDNKEMQRGPILDGLDEAYMLGQIQKFKLAQRGTHQYDYQGELMATAIKDLNEQDVAQAVALLARRTPRNYLRTVKGDSKIGKDLYEKNCLACHGDSAQGLKEANTGSLAILEDWYLLTQLRNYKSGRRGYHEKDIEGQAMRALVTPLSDQNLKDIVEYISYINLEE